MLLLLLWCILVMLLVDAVAGLEVDAFEETLIEIFFEFVVGLSFS